MITVVAGIIELDGKILIAQRKEDDHLAHKWEFPGGKLEADETPEQCIVRELREELSIQTECETLLGTSIWAYQGCRSNYAPIESAILLGPFACTIMLLSAGSGRKNWTSTILPKPTCRLCRSSRSRPVQTRSTGIQK
jgi:8-oxo-dGTP pyrophosphatase MutT (NUDIX family)